MNLYVLKRDHQEGQTIYGVFESEELALLQIETLKRIYKLVPTSDYVVKEITLNELIEIEAYE
ncbi:hypothetical protein NSQ62_07980 [Solibacillus sp. FSL H8-0523]|uniref:hypothetical protein n=1 Tax=Solibacillus sp. FSL H8-0523 TaxID=2954511 RepID=UPI003100CB6C